MAQSYSCPTCHRPLAPVKLRHEAAVAQSAVYRCNEHGLFEIFPNGRIVPEAVGTHDEPFRRGDPTLDDDEFA